MHLPQCLHRKQSGWVVVAACIAATAALAEAQTACKQLVSAAQPSAPVLQQRDRYRIQPGDVVEVSFPLSHEFDQSLTVAPDGYVALRGAGDLAVAGKSLPELRDALRAAYADVLHSPLVNVDLKDFQKPFFTVSGQVGRPGKYDLRENITVAEALAIAGGTTVNAKSSQVLLFRRVPQGSLVEVRKLDLHKMMKQGDLREDMRVERGDLLFVPQTAISKIERFLPTSSLGLYTTGVP
jgi:polysaccharide export outer membrane protein